MRGRDVYVHDVEPRKRGNDDRPNRPINLGYRLLLVLVAGYDMNL